MPLKSVHFCDQSSVSFAVTRVLMKIFRTRSLDVTDQCQIMFGMLPLEHHVFLRKVRFLLRFKNSDNPFVTAAYPPAVLA